MNIELDHKPEPSEEIFIPFLNDEEEAEFRSMQHLWNDTDDVLEQLKKAIENEE